MLASFPGEPFMYVSPAAVSHTALEPTCCHVGHDEPQDATVAVVVDVPVTVLPGMHENTSIKECFVLHFVHGQVTHHIRGKRRRDSICTSLAIRCDV